MELKEVILTEEQLRKLCAVYQRILRLQDWRIDLEVRRFTEDESRWVGLNSWCIDKKASSIRLLDPTFYPQDAIRPQDMELDLVHELVHLHFVRVVPAEDRGSPDIEFGVEAIAEAIVALRRAAIQHTYNPGQEPKEVEK